MCYIFIMAEFEISETDEDIILAYNNGDREAFKKLIDRYASPLYNFTARLSNKSDASDIVQESFIKAWKNISHFDPGRASFKTWIFTIAKNATTDFLRRKKSILFSDIKAGDEDDVNSFAENIPDKDLLPDESMQKLEDSKFLNTMLEKLPRDYREVLVLHYQEEMTFAEIGKVLRKPLNTVKSQHRRAVIELRKMIAN